MSHLRLRIQHAGREEGEVVVCEVEIALWGVLWVCGFSAVNMARPKTKCAFEVFGR